MAELTREVRMEFMLLVSSQEQGQVESSPERVLVVGLEGERVGDLGSEPVASLGVNWRRRVYGYWWVCRNWRVNRWLNRSRYRRVMGSGGFVGPRAGG